MLLAMLFFVLSFVYVFVYMFFKVMFYFFLSLIYHLEIIFTRLFCLSILSLWTSFHYKNFENQLTLLDIPLLFLLHFVFISSIIKNYTYILQCLKVTDFSCVLSNISYDTYKFVDKYETKIYIRCYNLILITPK